MLYSIKSFLDKHFEKSEEYVEVLDVDGVRTRISRGQYVSVKKRVIDTSRFVVPLGGGFVPMIKRECDETIYDKCGEKIKRLCKTRVYHRPDIYENLEIKFEHIYYEHNDGDSLDPLTANKQIALHNLLRPSHEIDVTNNSHLGTDEILANCRVELEYEDPMNMGLLRRMAHLIQFVEHTLLGGVAIEPFISHTSVFNEIMYRPFAEERLVSESTSSDDVVFWALKLDGVRGKGYIVNDHVLYVQLDDMQMFAYPLEVCMSSDAEPDASAQPKRWCSADGELDLDQTLKTDDRFFKLQSDAEREPEKFLAENLGSTSSSPNKISFNRILGVQVEYIDTSKTFYVTDVISLYKYNYDNRNQFDVSTAYYIETYDAINFMNTRSRFECKYGDYKIKFQCFKKERAAIASTDLSDGFVGVLKCGGLVKIKYQKSFEMKHVGGGVFKSSGGEYRAKSSEFKTGAIYEVIIDRDDDTVAVVKERLDRLLYN